jgi:hypothetical protein
MTAAALLLLQEFHTNKTKPEEQNLRNFLKLPRCAPGANGILQCDLQH